MEKIKQSNVDINKAYKLEIKLRNALYKAFDLGKVSDQELRDGGSYPENEGKERIKVNKDGKEFDL